MSTPDTMGDRDTAERQTLSREVVVSNSQGLHARPADLLAREARKWRSRIELVVDAHRVDGKSILDVLTLAAEAGTRVWQGLVDRSVLVRDCSSWPRLAGCLRVTVGTLAENDAFLAALGEVCPA